MNDFTIKTGLPYLDEILQNIRLGDNVVWQVDKLSDYRRFANLFMKQAVRDKRTCIYLRFAPHEPILGPDANIKVVQVDPKPGFDSFCSIVHNIIGEQGERVFYVFDNLSALVAEWATDESVANFFQVTCPYLFELNTVAYFGLTLGHHADSAVARIRDTTQILINCLNVKGNVYLHPQKVWDRYSPQMFLPHLITDESGSAVFKSGDAAEVSSLARRNPLRLETVSIAPWDTIYKRLVQFQHLDEPPDESLPEVAELKKELIRILFGSHPGFNLLADTYFGLDDLIGIRNRIIGSGRIGGKAAGMLLANSILKSKSSGFPYVRNLEEHDSFYIGSDVYFTFLVDNNLFRTRFQLSREGRISLEDFEELEKRFLAGEFPPEILEQFRNMLDYFGQAPIIVRSSSLLEDSFLNAFAGKYRSEFCINQGNPEERLAAFTDAVRIVYASAWNPDALSYRKKRKLDDRDEQMAILVQRVSGSRHEHYFFPALAGVAFSHNLYVWTNRIDPRQGVIRLVFGLGTRAVNRVGGDYPRMIAVSHPHLRPEAGTKIERYSQHEVDVLNLKKNLFETAPVSEILSAAIYPGLHLLVSIMRDGYPSDPKFELRDLSGAEPVMTFNNLIKKTEFVKVMGKILNTLETSYGRAVDVEFTASVAVENSIRVNILQCRPMFLPGASEAVAIPANIADKDMLIETQSSLNCGCIRDISYILYIDPAVYANIKNVTMKKTLGRIVGRINEHPRITEGKIIMIGPGRWGSSNIDLGVNVTFADINNVSALIEVADIRGNAPEVSYGTHFFLDLVESAIIYLPVFFGNPATRFNGAFFASAANELSFMFPDSAEFADALKIIDVRAAAGGKRAHVIADTQSRKALCYLS